MSRSHHEGHGRCTLCGDPDAWKRAREAEAGAIDLVEGEAEAEERHYPDYVGYHGCDCPWCECRCDEPMSDAPPLRVSLADRLKAA